MVALVDCNSFYASCEAVFRPDLKGRPIVVLSNNDGCVIAANKEAKAMTHIPMYEPIFKIKNQLLANGVNFFSSNYTLYGEMSQRVINILKTFSPKVEVYSIDESFLDLSIVPMSELEAHGHKIKDIILQYTGLPVGVGIARTKVLAKVANRMAKKIPDLQHVCVVDSAQNEEELLKWCKIDDVWGIGKQHTKRLKSINIHNAHDFTRLPLAWVRKEMTVVGERLWRELNGEKAIEMVMEPKKKKGIGTAKSFGKKLCDLGLIEEACAFYITEVAEVLRAQGTCAGYLTIFLTTNYHSDYDKQYANRITLKLEVPTNSTFILIKEANQALRKIFKSGYRYKKVGVDVTGIVPENEVQGNLFRQDPSNLSVLSETVDKLNAKFGKAKVRSSTLGKRMKQWELIKEERSPRYTTQWNELLTVGKCKPKA